MSDKQQNSAGDDQSKRSLSDIGHLFLSSVRDRHMGDAPRPQRTPPKPAPQNDAPMDLTPEEFARAFESGGLAPSIPNQNYQPAPQRAEDEGFENIPPVTAVLAPHLNGSQRQRVREYAAHLCKTGERIGLIELDAFELRLSCFELGATEAAAEATVCDSLDARRITEVLEEMSWDVDRWLVNIPNPRLHEARELLSQINRWTVLATCDHDGVVACYRSLKGLSDLHRSEQPKDTGAKSISLALLDCEDEAEAAHVFGKLASVCQQFLHWPLENEAAVLAAGSVVEHQALVCKAARDRAELAPQWQIVGAFVGRSSPRAQETKAAAPVTKQEVEPTPQVAVPVAPVRPATPPTSSGVVISADPATTIRIASQQPVDARTESANDSSAFSEVIDLPAGVDSAAAIVAATVHGESGLVECPVKPPMLADASLAVARDRRLILLAVAKQGLSDLRLIGEAWHWMNENRALIAMAVPQLSIDPHQMPHLRLLVDRADSSASTLQPMLQTGNVTVNTYRKLRWGAKTGLLLEAA